MVSLGPSEVPACFAKERGRAGRSRLSLTLRASKSPTYHVLRAPLRGRHGREALLDRHHAISELAWHEHRADEDGERGHYQVIRRQRVNTAYQQSCYQVIYILGENGGTTNKRVWPGRLATFPRRSSSACKVPLDAALIVLHQHPVLPAHETQERRPAVSRGGADLDRPLLEAM